MMTSPRKNHEILVPPLNFALVAEGIYRSGHPLKVNHPFLEQLHLKTVIYIGDPSDDQIIDTEYREWAELHGIKLVCFKAASVKEPFVENDPDVIKASLEIILDTRNLPILLHSNKGKHRVGVLVGVMRQVLQGWSLSAIFDEYTRFAQGKGDADLEFIELFKPELSYNPEYCPKWVRC